MNFSINKVAVLGAGAMGAGIAAHLAGAGIPVYLLDIVPNELTEAEKKKGLTLESTAVRNRFAQEGKERVLKSAARSIYDPSLGSMIQIGNLTDDLHWVKDTDWIIEVVVENLEVKKQLFQRINQYRRQGSIVSSNTSGVSINKMVEDLPLEFRQHFLGTHFFNPPRWMKLLEIIPSNDCLPELVEFIRDFGTKRLGKGIVLAKDTPNFIGNRIGAFSSASIIKTMLKYGYNVVQVDEITGPVMGRQKSATFRTLDMVGLDIFHHVAGNARANISDEVEKKEFETPVFIMDLIAKGFLGDKTKQGIYKKVKTEKCSQILSWDYNSAEYLVQEKGELPTVVAAQKVRKLDDKLKTLIFGKEKDSQFAWEVIKNILLYTAKTAQEISDDFKAIDQAMMWGYNWEIGPFGIWDAIGLEESIARMREEGDVIPKWIEDRLAAGQDKFYTEDVDVAPYIILASKRSKKVLGNEAASLIDIGDDVACLEFQTKSNVVNDKVIEAMVASLDEVKKNFAGLVIGNQGKNFCVGANLAIVAELSQNKEWHELEELVNRFQTANMLLKYSAKPVVAAPYNMTLGGGAEIVMHSHRVAAHAETYMGLVEVGVGLVPGGGGTKEMLLRQTQDAGEAGNHLLPGLRKAWDTIVTAKVSSSGLDAMKLGYLSRCDQMVMSRDYLLDEAKKLVLYLAKSGFRQLQKKDITVAGNTGKAALQLVIDFMLNGGFISAHDAHITNKVAGILSGGDVPYGVKVSEERILELEKEAFVSLCGEEKTQQRIEYMLLKGKPLRN